MSGFINENFVPLEAHIKEHAAYFHRFDAVWTPTVLVLDSDGEERLRVEGYLPKEEFRAQLEMGLARVAFMNKQWAEAERRYAALRAQPALGRGVSCPRGAKAYFFSGVLGEQYESV